MMMMVMGLRGGDGTNARQDERVQPGRLAEALVKSFTSNQLLPPNNC